MKKQQPAVFFDRDGVLNVDHGYTYRPQDFQWMPGAIEAIKYCNEHNYLVLVITNQSGIARGYYKEEDVKRLHEHMISELKKQDAHIDAFYYCPHHPEGKITEYIKICTCRKPAPGMINSAMKEWPIDKTKSFVIGDKPSDMAAAEAVGMKGYLFTENNLFSYVKEIIHAWNDNVADD